MTDVTDTTTDTETVADGEQKQEQGKTFTQEEVNRIVNARLKQQAKNEFGDYETVKTTAQTLEQRLGSLESELTQTKAEALRTSIAARFGISTEKGAKGEPSDADLFLTGTDESTLTAQAERLAGRRVDEKKTGNVARKEGGTTTSGDGNKDLRTFTRNLFAAAQTE